MMYTSSRLQAGISSLEHPSIAAPLFRIPQAPFKAESLEISQRGIRPYMTAVKLHDGIAHTLGKDIAVLVDEDKSLRTFDIHLEAVDDGELALVQQLAQR